MLDVVRTAESPPLAMDGAGTASLAMADFDVKSAIFHAPALDVAHVTGTGLDRNGGKMAELLMNSAIAGLVSATLQPRLISLTEQSR